MSEKDEDYGRGTMDDRRKHQAAMRAISADLRQTVAGLLEANTRLADLDRRLSRLEQR